MQGGSPGASDTLIFQKAEGRPKAKPKAERPKANAVSVRKRRVQKAEGRPKNLTASSMHPASTSGPVAIETVGLAKAFGPVQAVQGLNLRLMQGEMFGLVGPDGAGKSTTIRMLAGVIPPDAGAATLLGLDLRRDAEALKRRIGYLSQRFSLYGDLSIDENIAFFAEIHDVRDYRSRREELLAFTRLTPFRNRLAERLSGGMKQKLALACTLIHQPELLFLDEPTTGVDPVSRRDFWKILADLLATGMTILMSTPYLDEAERCNRVGLLHEGRLLVVGTPQAVRARLPGTVVELMGQPLRPAFRLLQGHPQVRMVQAFGDRLDVVVRDAEADLPVLLDLLKTHQIQITHWRTVPASLENVFIHMVTEN